jgi:glucose/mannose-6-phosphate isomerase
LLGGAIAVLRGAEAVTADTDLGAAAELADTILRPDGAARQLAIDLSEGLVGRMVGIYGSMGVTAPTAQRWKTQINENAKWPAWWSLLPELDHNEIVSWSALSDLTRRKVGIVTLRDRDEGPRVEARFRHTASVTEDDVAWVGEVWAQGDTALERMVSLAIVGDLVSLELARLAGVDPVPVDAIEDLKRKLSEE